MDLTRPYLLPCLFLGLLVLPGCEDDSEVPGPSPSPTTNTQTSRSYEIEPKPVPDVTLTTLNEKKIDLTQAEGQVFLVNFWATWCAPCRKEIPDLIDLQKSLGDDGLKVIGISLDKDDPSEVRSYVEKQEINYPIVLDPKGEVEAQFGGTYGIPTTFVVNSEGQIVRRVIGILPTEEIRPELESMLENESGAST